MSAPELTDAQLDALLGQVPSPQAPTGALGDRIMARAAATPQHAAHRFVPAPRRLGRRPFILTTIIAANALAAAAAASSWDGQRFDFNRLADLPHRVAAAIHLPHHNRGQQEKPVQSHELARVGTAKIPALTRPVVSATPRKAVIPVGASLGMRNPASSAYRGGHVAVTVTAHPKPGRERPERAAESRVVRRTKSHEFATYQAPPPSVMKLPPAAHPDAGRNLAGERAYTQSRPEIRPDFRPEIDRNHRFDGTEPNNWQRLGLRARSNPRIGAGRQRPWQKWRRNFRPRLRNQVRRFARRF